jgi:hypothetical protein
MTIYIALVFDRFFEVRRLAIIPIQTNPVPKRANVPGSGAVVFAGNVVVPPASLIEPLFAGVNGFPVNITVVSWVVTAPGIATNAPWFSDIVPFMIVPKKTQEFTDPDFVQVPPAVKVPLKTKPPVPLVPLILKLPPELKIALPAILPEDKLPLENFTVPKLGGAAPS